MYMGENKIENKFDKANELLALFLCKPLFYIVRSQQRRLTLFSPITITIATTPNKNLQLHTLA